MNGLDINWTPTIVVLAVGAGIIAALRFVAVHAKARTARRTRLVIETAKREHTQEATQERTT